MTLSLLRGSVRLNTLLPPRPDLLCSRVRVRPVSPGTTQVAGFIQTDRPFFDVHVELDLPHVKMSPPLADIQTAINRCSRAVLGCSKALTVWKSDATAVRGSSIYEVVTRDREVIRVVLLLAGSVEGAKRQVHEFLSTFMKYEYLWVDNMADAYAQFMAKNPTLEDFEAELKKYVDIEVEIQKIPPVHNIGALSLETAPLKYSLKSEAAAWRSTRRTCTARPRRSSTASSSGWRR